MAHDRDPVEQAIKDSGVLFELRASLLEELLPLAR